MESNVTDLMRVNGDDMPGGFFVYRADEKEEILYANDVVADIFGCKSQDELKELTGNSFSGMIYPEDLEAVEKSINEQVHKSERRLDYVEYRIRRKNGEIRWVDDYGRLVHTEEFGDVYYVFIRDITEIHLQREENKRKAEVIEGLSADYITLYLMDLESGKMQPYHSYSSHFAKIASEIYGPDESIEWEKIPPVFAERYVIKEDRDIFLDGINPQRIRERLLREKAYTVNYRSKVDDEEMQYAQMSIVQVNNSEHGYNAVIGFREITEQVLSAQKELADRLSMEAELHKEKQANEIKTAFLFNISHDIRTPMNAIKGFTDLALMHIDETDKLREYLNKVDESNRYMLSLIDDLLEMSSIDYGKVEIKEKSCKLKEAIKAALDMLQTRMDEKGLTLESRLDLTEDNVYLDEARFQRIMGNLLENAVKFTPDGGRITVSAGRRQVSDSGYARYEISVRDTGIGMSDEFMKRIFHPFEREESATISGQTGTGLGLSITKKLIDLMGGSISVESRKGQGSVFTIGLPLRLAGDKQPVQKEASVPKAEDSSRKHRILLVEDIEINRALAENILNEAGFMVESVADGSDAVEAVRDHEKGYYDLILMDIQMPVMNGYEATRRIRGMDRADAKTIPIIALSANAREEDKKESMESGMDSHIAKPFDISHLVNTINEHIAKGSSEAAR